MDLNGDGILDLLSGSYSKNDGDMAGVLYWLAGKEESFEPAEPLRTEDGDLLLIHTERKGVDRFADRICTKPWAADLDGDGHLDLVVGNMVGHFALFRGREEGGFERESSFLKLESGERMSVGRHSDPLLVDWDSDGDLDLLSGSDAGGVCLFVNSGSVDRPRFRGKQMLLPEFSGDGDFDGANMLLIPAGATLDRPGRNTRIAVADVDGDGQRDILLMDRTEALVPAQGISFEDCQADLLRWAEEMSQLEANAPEFDIDGEITAEVIEHAAKEEAHRAKRNEFAREHVLTGAWLLRGKTVGRGAEGPPVR
ncbi:FG-GAP repeat protein [Planctomycetes bacterium Poly30]|uniref:FG-GAP repeat protein n=1 Tax=Saltatorellus ferox TaxID=2528018 RepID=A0A518EXQ5_9BACT|nr:FG-GAP repeat protein [Planctomycetes bacterium Poly30]